MSNLTGLYPLPHGNSTLLNNPSLCTTSTCDLSFAPISYQPSLKANALFLSIFSFCLAFQIGIGLKFRTYSFTSIIFVGFNFEIIGYTTRLLLWKNPFSLTYFSLQLTALSAGPTILSLAIYVCFGRIVVIYGEEISRFRARTYTIPLVSIASTVLLLQLIGGILTTSKDTSIIRTGKDILITSFIIHLLSLTTFIILAAEFSLHIYQSRSVGHTPPPTETSLFEAFLIGLTLSTLLLTRTIFRIIELSSGLKGPVAGKQVLFIIAEGVLIAIVALMLTILHPGPSFQGFYSSSTYPITRIRPSSDDLVEITAGKRISVSSSTFSTHSHTPSRNGPTPNSNTDMELTTHNGLESPPMYQESEEEGSVHFALGMSTRSIRPGMVRMQQVERPRVARVVDDLELGPPSYGGVVGVRYEDTRVDLPEPRMVERC